MEANEALSALNETIKDQGNVLKLKSVPNLVRRDCALLILEAILEFLKIWPGKRQRELPRIMIRNGLAAVLSELGPHDDQLYRILLNDLPKVANCRDQLLDILPYCIPIEQNRLSKATREILETLREVLMQDASLLVPVIGTFSSIPLSQDDRQEVWKLAFVSFHDLEDTDYPAVAKTLLRYTTNCSEAAKTWEVLRQCQFKDFNLIPEIIISALQNKNNCIELEMGYMKVMGKIEERLDEKSEIKIVPLDLIIILELSLRESSKVKLDSFLDTLIIRYRFPFQQLSIVVENLCRGQCSGVQQRLKPALLNLGLFLLLSPIRIEDVISFTVLSQVNDYHLNLYHCLDRVRQDELIRSLLHLGDEISIVALSQKQKVKQRQIDLTCQSVHKIIELLAEKDPAGILRFKPMLLQRFTSSKGGTGYQQVSSILVKMVDHGSGHGIDSTELMVLLQKLMFCCHGQWDTDRNQETHHNNVDKVARGILLATHMIQSPAFSIYDKECIYQSVQKVLLPTNRRTVQAKVGLQGLNFLSLWSLKQERQANVFQNLKMILANTGLVQAKDSYHIQNGTIFAYDDLPSCFLEKSTTTFLKKKRHFLFCLKSYLQFRIPTRPYDWGDEVSWVFHLIDTYLRHGCKNRKSKWQPNGWLEGSLELPSLSFEEESNAIFSNYNVEISCDSINMQFEFRARMSLVKDSFLIRKAKIEDMFRLALALLLSMSLSIAVLKNCHEHLYPTEKDSHIHEVNNVKRIVTKNLLKYQILKVNDLKRRSEVLAGMLKSAALGLRRFSKELVDPDDANSQIQLLEEASENIENVVMSKLLLKSPTLIPANVLKTCLIDELDDAFLISNETINTRFNMIVKLRSQLLQHLIFYYYDSKDDIFDSKIVMHSALFLMKLMGTKKLKMEEGEIDIRSRLNSLISLYLSLIISVLECAIKIITSHHEKCITLLRAMLWEKDKRNETDLSILVSSLFNQFIDLFKDLTEALIAGKVAEILSLLAQLDRKKLIPKALDVCWQMMHMIYSRNDDREMVRVPFTFELTINRILYSGIPCVVKKILRASIMKSSTRHEGNPTRRWIQQPLLLIWSLMVTPTLAPPKEAVILSCLIDDLKCYVERSNCKDFSKVSQRVLDLPKIQSLNGNSIYVFIESVLQMLISIFAVIEPSRSPEKNYTSLGPFAHLEIFPRLFEQLLLLVNDIITHLPKRLVSLLIVSCHNLLDLSVVKVRQCVEWRQSQPLLLSSELNAGKRDNASIYYLESMIHEISLSCVNIVASFCHRSQKYEQASIEEKDDLKNPYAHCDRKLTALLTASERTWKILRTIAQSHNMVFPNHIVLRMIGKEADTSTKKSTYSEEKCRFYGQYDDFQAEEYSKIRKKRLKVEVGLLEPANEKDGERDESMEDTERNVDETTVGSDNGFRVNWGQEDSEEKSVMSSSEFSLKLENDGINLLLGIR